MNNPLIKENIDDACSFLHGTKVVRIIDVISAVQGFREEYDQVLRESWRGDNEYDLAQKLTELLDKWFVGVVKK